MSHSISKGDPVVVVGAIRTHEWDSEQGRRSRPQIRAQAVAPNLARGVADFRRTQRQVAPATEEPGPAEDGAAELDELLAGRDYEGEDALLQGMDSALSPEPARV